MKKIVLVFLFVFSALQVKAKDTVYLPCKKITNNSGGSLKIFDGYFENKDYNAILHNNESGLIEIYGGNFINNNTSYPVIDNRSKSNYGRVYIYGGTFNSQNKTINNENNGRIYIYGGTLQSNSSEACIYNKHYGNIVIGNDDGQVSKESPVIISRNNVGVHNRYRNI